MPAKTKPDSRRHVKSDLERLYTQHFAPTSPALLLDEGGSLEQPSPLLVVPSFATDGFTQQPISVNCGNAILE
jgi:hypothetical protein